MGPLHQRQHEAVASSVAHSLASCDAVTMGVFGDEGQTKLLGACTVRIFEKPHVWVLSGLYVIPAAQGKGLGQRLVELCLHHRTTAQARSFVLDVYSPTNGPDSPARTLYKEKFGFSDTWSTEVVKDDPLGLTKYTMNMHLGTEPS